MQKLRVGIIGAGRIGQVHAKSITYHIPQAEIVAISDLFPENAQKVADDLGIPKAVQDYHEILNDPTVDAVLICSLPIPTRILPWRQPRPASISFVKSRWI